MTRAKKHRGKVVLQAGLGLVAVVYGFGCTSAPGSNPDRFAQRAHDVAEARLTAHRAEPSAVTGRPHEGHGAESRSAIPAAWDATSGASYRLAAANIGSAPEVNDDSSAHIDAPATQPAGGPLPGFRETLARDLQSFPRELWSDTKSVYGNPWNLAFLLGAGGTSVTFRETLDDRIEDRYDERHTMSSGWRESSGAMGNPITHFAMAGLWYVAGQQFQDVKTYETGKRMVNALTITGLSTLLLKGAASTESPNGENHAWPSGHVSSTMAMATVLHHAYGPLVGVPMFGVTGLVAVQRLDTREHHFSDVVFGAALGWVVAEQIMKDRPVEVGGGQIVPYADPASGHAGIAWVRPLGP